MIGDWLQLDDGHRQPSFELSSFYFDRVGLSGKLQHQLSTRKGLLIYGAPRQGKTALLKRSMGTRPYVIVDASTDFGFADTTRNYLLSVGCSVTTESKKKGRIGTKAEIKFKLPVLEATAGADGGYDVEQTLRTMTTDISNPNDVCYLLRASQIELPPLIIDHFERFKKKERQRTLHFMKTCHEHGLMKLIFVAGSIDMPLTTWERLEFLPYMNILEIPPLSREESQAFSREALDVAGCSECPNIGETVYELFSGAVGLTADACSLVASSWPTHPSSAASADWIKDLVGTAFRSRFTDYFINLLRAIIGLGLTIDYEEVRRRSRRKTKGDGEPDAVPAATPAAPRRPLKRRTVNVGVIMCDLLMKSELDEPVIFSAVHIDGFLTAESMVVEDSSFARNKVDIMRALSKRINKVQRKHFIVPPMFRVDDSFSAITLWEPRKLHSSVEVKAAVERILEGDDDDDDY